MTGQGRFRLASNDPFPQLPGHPLHIVRARPQPLGDLGVGQVQPHEMQTQDPHSDAPPTPSPSDHRSGEGSPDNDSSAAPLGSYPGPAG